MLRMKLWTEPRLRFSTQIVGAELTLQRFADSIDELKTTTNSLAVADGAIAKRVNQFETALQSINGTGGLAGQVQDANTRMNAMMKELADISGTLSGVASMRGEIDTMSAGIANNASRIDQAISASATATSEAKTRDSNALTAIDSLSKELVTAGKRVDALSADLSKLTADVTEQLNSGIPLPTMFNAVSPVCSTVVMLFAPYGSSEGGMFSGSGSFITLSDSDLKDGLFLTCAHNIIESVDGVVQSIQEAYIENPLNGQWVRVTRNMVFVDGVGDIALIKTGINFNGSAIRPLKLSSVDVKTGEHCVVVGDPAMIDSDSMASGIVRSARYEMKPVAYQINECLHIDAPTVGGNSGSPILNTDGNIIGMLTYGQDGASTLGGGPNLSSLKKSLSVLSTFKNNKSKRYIGMVWGVVFPTTIFQLKALNPSLAPTTSGVQVYQVNPMSPFYGTIRAWDVILTVQVFGANGQAITPAYSIGVHDGEMPLGFLLYEYAAASVKVTYVSGQNGAILTKTVPFTKTYANVPDAYDVPLSTGLKTPIKQARFD